MSGGDVKGEIDLEKELEKIVASDDALEGVGVGQFNATCANLREESKGKEEIA